MQRQQAKEVCSPYTCMQGIRKLPSGGYELSSQHHVILQAAPDFDVLELEELACGVLELEVNKAPDFERAVQRDGEGASAGKDFHNDGWLPRSGYACSSLRWT